MRGTPDRILHTGEGTAMCRQLKSKAPGGPVGHGPRCWCWQRQADPDRKGRTRRLRHHSPTAVFRRSYEKRAGAGTGWQHNRPQGTSRSQMAHFTGVQAEHQGQAFLPGTLGLVHWGCRFLLITCSNTSGQAMCGVAPRPPRSYEAMPIWLKAALSPFCFDPNL